MSGPAADRERALRLIPVSRETAGLLDRFVELLATWQKTTNLVAPSALPEIWTRHVADSLQLFPLAPGATLWIDLGSGGGFPGIPLACLLADVEGGHMHLVESNQKKAAFLREAARMLGLPVTVHAQRIEDFTARFEGHADAVTARALAPLKKLIPGAYPLLKTGTKLLFPKGQDIGAELTKAAKYWTIGSEMVPSKTGDGQILIVTSLAKK
ncbi:MAG: 16S rRNA (guanine(527)-N(7))-methyltransferase RsmG [Pseudorhodoplanes sp.]|nr:16S rRNA (guanine(527)-N(7))-methyltransferase RsmG [Pseudorhodoplanes sp.]